MIELWQLPLLFGVGLAAGFVDTIAGGVAFFGNDSGPGHIAALCGVPTFTIFGPQLPEWFAPLHPGSEWLEGKACPYKPCSDYCQFPTPYCMVRSSLEEVIARVDAFLARALPSKTNPAALPLAFV